MRNWWGPNSVRLGSDRQRHLVPRGVRIVVVADELDHPAFAARRGAGVDGVHEAFEIGVEQLEPLGVEVVRQTGLIASI